MLMAVRIYGSEANAQEAARKLVEAGIRKDLVHVLTPDSGVAEQAVQAAVSARKLPTTHVKAAINALKNGNSVVAVPLPYFGQEVVDLLDSCGPIETETPATQLPNDPAPFSDMLGIPVLTKDSRSSASLLRGDKPVIGFPLLTRSSTGKSSSFGMPLLSKSSIGKSSSFGLPLLTRSDWSLSSMIGLPTLTGPKKR
jgi:hypothetical protein